MSNFARYAFVFMRQHEVRADRAAADVCGAGTMADALTGLALLRRATARHIGLTTGMGWLESSGPSALGREVIESRQDPAMRRRDLRAALAEDHDLADVHPSLRARLLGLGRKEPKLPAEPLTSAAQRYFGPRLDAVCARVDQVWRREEAFVAISNRSNAELRRRIGTAKDELARLETTAVEEATSEDLRRRASLTEWLRGGLAALPLLDALAQHDDAAGLAGAGRIRLLMGDAKGLELIDRAIALDRSVASTAAPVARDFLRADGRDEDAARYEAIVRKEAEKATRSFLDRAELRPEDELTAHDLPAEVVAAIAQILSRVDEVARAYLVRKVVAGDRLKGPLFLALVYRTPWFVSAHRSDADALTLRITEAVGHHLSEFTVFVANGHAGKKRIEEFAGALVYRAGWDNEIAADSTTGLRREHP
jgi:hypothetical protein